MTSTLIFLFALVIIAAIRAYILETQSKRPPRRSRQRSYFSDSSGPSTSHSSGYDPLMHGSSSHGSASDDGYHHCGHHHDGRGPDHGDSSSFDSGGSSGFDGGSYDSGGSDSGGSSDSGSSSSD